MKPSPNTERATMELNLGIDNNLICNEDGEVLLHTIVYPDYAEPIEFSIPLDDLVETAIDCVNDDFEDANTLYAIASAFEMYAEGLREQADFMTEELELRIDD